MYSEIDYKVVDISCSLTEREQIEVLLKMSDLELDTQVSLFIVAKVNSIIIACAGLDHNIIKCVAIHPDYKGNQISLTLIDHIIKYAYEMGYFHVFLYTKPENKDFFSSCGFYCIAEVKDLAVLMENTPVGIKRYCKSLNIKKRAGSKIGSIVMNANPFTKGHLYLAQHAASQCDWLHLFVVNEDASLFLFKERLDLVQKGIKDIKNITVHSSSSYIISKVTFPAYFLKDQTKINIAYMGIDLLIFRNYIAPALHITHRFVGSEPFSKITKAYNDSMQYWLQEKTVSAFPKVELVEIDRIIEDNVIVSASLVRKLLLEKQYEKVKKIVPHTTWEYIEKNLDKLTNGFKR